MNRNGKESRPLVQNSLSSIDVANEIIAICRDKGVTLYPSKLIKLVVIAHGWNLAHTKLPLINDDVYAWSAGPVPIHLYNVLANRFGEELPANLVLQDDDLVDTKLSNIEHDIVEATIEKYGECTAQELSDLTHNEDTPWSNYYNARNLDTVIPQDAIRSHYETLLYDANIKPLWKESPELFQVYDRNFDRALQPS